MGRVVNNERSRRIKRDIVKVEDAVGNGDLEADEEGARGLLEQQLGAAGQSRLVDEINPMVEGEPLGHLLIGVLLLRRRQRSTYRFLGHHDGENVEQSVD